MKYRVEIYQTERGQRPFVDWMMSDGKREKDFPFLE